MTFYIALAAFGSVGLIFSVWAVRRIFRTVMFLSLSQKTSATVVRFAAARSSDGHSTYKPVLEFQTAGGRNISVTATVASNPPVYQIGERAQVRFLPKNPNRAKINSFGELWLVTLVIGGIGVLLLGVTFYVYRYAI